MHSRRSFLGRVAAGAGLIGVSATAGCLGSVPGLGGGAGNAPDYASRLYDPSEVADLSGRLFASYDLATLYERRGLYPDSLSRQLEQADTTTEAVTVSELDRLTGFGVVPDDPQAAQSGRTRGAGSVMLSGSFDADAVVEQLRAQSGDGESLQSAGSANGHDLYTVENATDQGSSALAVSDETVFVGGAADLDTTGEDAVRAMLSSSDAGYYSSSDTGQRLIDALGSPTTVVGAEFTSGEFAPEDSQGQPGGESLRAVVEGLTAVGTAMTFGQDTVERQTVSVYEEGETPTADDAQSLLDVAAAGAAARAPAGTDGESIQQLIQDMEPSVDGRTLTVSVSRNTEALFRSDSSETPVSSEAAVLVAPGVAVLGTFLLEFGGGGNRQQRVPRAQFQYDYDASAGEVAVTHAGGDTFDQQNTRRLDVVVDGEPRGAFRLPASAGDSTAVPAESGSTVRVVWSAPDGDSSVLSESQVP
jgi:hypothetical protein